MKVKEGRRIKSSIPMDMVSPFIMPTRIGASNTFYASVDIGKCEELIKQKRAEGLKKFGMIHIFMAAYIRVISQLPGVNRFIRGQRLYARNSIDICMTIKKELKLNAPETVVKINAQPTDTLETVYNRLYSVVIENKQDGEQNNMDAAAKFLVCLPGIFLRGVVNILTFFDYFGLLPRFLTNLSPFHGSMFITNMGSLGMPPIFHHLYNFGNLPVFIAMGAKRTEYTVNKNGEVEKKRMIDFSVVCDERICDGHYYATAFKLLKKMIENPEKLLDPPETVIEDIK